MSRRPKKFDHFRRNVGRTNPCRYGLIYAVSACSLGAVFVPTPTIVDQLSTIEGVRFVVADGDYGNVVFPPIRLPEVAAVLEPLGRRPDGGMPGSRRGRLW